MINVTRFALLYTLLILFTVSFRDLSGQSLQYENLVIESVEIDMAAIAPGVTFDPCSVTSRIKTRKGEIFSQIDLDNDLKTLAIEFDRVEPTLTCNQDKLFITLKIWPKPTIRSITWNGNHKIETKKLEKELGINPCSIFDRQSFNTAFHKLKAYYVKKGFFEASLDYKYVLDNTANEVDVEVCIKEGRAGRIKNIMFDGFTCKEQEDLLEAMVTKKYNIFLSWVNEEGTYNEEAVQQDRFTILSYLQNEGYADATVNIEVCEAKQANRIVIKIIADKGDIYKFSTISFDGNILFTDKEIKSRITFAEGEAFSPDAIRSTVRRISEFYGRRGYIDAVVDYETKLNCDQSSYSIHLTIEEGERFYVGLIKVFGNCSTQTNVILHETFLAPGEIFNISKLQLTEEKLRNIGYFKNVNVYAVKSEGPGGLGTNYRDVHIEVEETSTGNFGAGFGFSSVESLFGEFRITERNFNYKGFSKLFTQGYSALRGGGEYLHLNAMIGLRSRKYSLSWTKPFFLDTPWIVGFEIERTSNRYVSKDYDIEGTGGTIHGAYQINQFFRVGLHYRLRNTFVRLETKKAGKEEKKELRNEGLISAAGVSINYDSTDHPAAPTRGFKSKLEQEIAGFGGDQRFFSVGYTNSYYIKAGSKGVLKFRADLRFITPIFESKRSRIPLDERLFLGGENTIRGFRSYKIGPVFKKTGDPKGGMSMQLLSAEYNRQIFKRLDAFLFCDSGFLTMKVWELGIGRLYTSVGFGVKVVALDSLPPIVLGMGFPLNPRSRGDVKKFFFTIGGQF
ncbi:MAG: outer membrane protein assembly factor BamA [Parachlamydiaceae bacterium]|nr:outer membrane protein assembly factor BamA [Parachlamydiaceae bacterium]